MLPLPRTLHSSKSGFSGEIRVVQKGRERQLLVGGYVQSINWDCPEVKKRVWGKLANEALLLVSANRAEPADPPTRRVSAPPPDGCCSSGSAPPRILILGLGGGTEIHLISHQYPNTQFSAVEIDPEIIKLAKRYFDVDKIPNLEIVNEDAFEYLKSFEKTIREKSPKKHDKPPRDTRRVKSADTLRVEELAASQHKARWDLIICDIYAGGNYPPEAESDWFLKKIAGSAEHAIFNRIFDSTHSPQAEEYIKRLEHYFKAVKPIIVHHKALNILFSCSS